MRPSDHLIPAFLSVDVEPDGFQYPNLAWTGFESIQGLVERVRSELAQVSGSNPRFGWYLRMDPQVAQAHGRPDYLAVRYSDDLSRLRQAGDDFPQASSGALITEVVGGTLVGVIGTAADAPTRFRPRPMLLCALAAGGAIVLAACGNDSGDTAKSTTMPSRTTVAPTTTTAPPVMYQVTRGDTLTSIAAFFGLSTATLAEANQLGNQDQLTEGQILVIPPTPPPQLTITPDGGHAGETFMLTVTGAKAGETITFEIDGPGPGTFTGSPHTASQEGAVTTRYESSGDDPGKYTVVANGDRGTSLRASYRLLE